jgi:hypothetical protein
MVAVQVNDKDGKPLTKVKAGETVERAKERIFEEFKVSSGSLKDHEGVPCLETELISAEEAPYEFMPFTPQQESHQNQWFCVTGTIERPKSSAGDRFKLVQLARGGYYPPNGDVEDAFQCQAHPDKDELRLISVRVVFLDEMLLTISSQMFTATLPSRLEWFSIKDRISEAVR